MAFLCYVLMVAFLISTKWASLVQSCPPECVCDSFKTDCRNKGLDNIPSAIPLEVRELILSENFFKEIPPLDMDYYHELVILNFSHNLIDIDPDINFPALDNLAYLDLSHNHLTAVSASTFSQLRRLVFLNISHNTLLKAVDPEAFPNNPLLAYIDMSYCGVESLSADTFKSLRNLRDLAIMKNPFDCNCTLLEFCSWLRHTRLYTHNQSRPRVRLVENDAVVCKNPSKVKGWQILKAEEKIHYDCLLHITAKDYMMLCLISFCIFIGGTIVAGMIGITVVIYHNPTIKVDDESDEEGEYKLYTVAHLLRSS